MDIAKLNFSPKLSQRIVVVMDVDSAAIQIECIDEIAGDSGCWRAFVSAITESAMRGGLDFEQSLRCRVGTLKVRRSILQQVRREFTVNARISWKRSNLAKIWLENCNCFRRIYLFCGLFESLVQLVLRHQINLILKMESSLA